MDTNNIDIINTILNISLKTITGYELNTKNNLYNSNCIFIDAIKRSKFKRRLVVRNDQLKNICIIIFDANSFAIKYSKHFFIQYFPKSTLIKSHIGDFKVDELANNINDIDIMMLLNVMTECQRIFNEIRIDAEN